MSEPLVPRDTKRAHAPSPDAARQRRGRQRMAAGIVRIDLAIGASGLDGHVSCGWLREEGRADRNAVKAAMAALVIHAIQRNIRRP